RTINLSVSNGQIIYFYVSPYSSNSWVNISGNAVPTSTANGCLARGLNSNTAANSGGIGTVVYYGGNGGNSNHGGGGGGGSAGPNGNGKIGGTGGVNSGGGG